nr:uncharacterized protein pb7e8.02 [Quercus suber]
MEEVPGLKLGRSTSLHSTPFRTVQSFCYITALLLRLQLETRLGLTTRSLSAGSHTLRSHQTINLCKSALTHPALTPQSESRPQCSAPSAMSKLRTTNEPTLDASTASKLFLCHRHAQRGIPLTTPRFRAMVLNKHDPKFLERTKQAIVHDCGNLQEMIGKQQQQSLKTQDAFHEALAQAVNASLATGLAQREYARALIAPQGPLSRVTLCFQEAEEELAAVQVQGLEETFRKDRAQTAEAKLYKKKYSEEQYKWLMMFSRNNAQGNVNPNAPQNFNENNRNPMLANAPATVAGMTRESTSLKPKAIKRLASPHEVKMLAEKEGNEAKAKRTCQQKVAHLHLEMEILDAEFQWDFQKVIFYYYADKYINFKDLITELYRIYKSRIWLSAVNPASFSQHAMGQPPNGIGPGAITVGDNAFNPLTYSPVDPDPYGAVRPYQIEPTYTPNYPSIPGVVNSFASHERVQNNNLTSSLYPATAPHTVMHQHGNLANYNFYYDRSGSNEHSSPQPRHYNGFQYNGMISDQHVYNNSPRGFAAGQRANAPHQEVQPAHRQHDGSPASPFGPQQQNWLNTAYSIRTNMPRESAVESHVLEDLRNLAIGNNNNRATRPDESVREH